MPNWCSNEVIISGSKAKLKKIEKVLKRCKKDGIFFDRIIPIPKNLRDAKSPSLMCSDECYQKMYDPGFEFHDWYEWCLVKWGTKWDVEIIEMKVKDKCIYIYYDSAWSPPIEFLIKFSEMFDVNIKTRYLEPMHFVGRSIIKKGKLISRDDRTDLSRKNIKHFGFEKSFPFYEE